MKVSYVSVGGIIIDDIIRPDGVTHMGVLGGAATHAMAGMRVWTREVGLLAQVGYNFPPEGWARLETYGVDLSGVKICDVPTPRAWQIFDEEERRTEIFRTPVEDFTRLTTPSLSDVPPSYLDARGFYIVSGEFEWLSYFIEGLKRMGTPVVLWEPAPTCMDKRCKQEVMALLPKVDIFSPNLEEAARVCGKADVGEVLEELTGEGAKVVALRMGEKGSAISTGGQILLIPPAPARVVDVTGAGNAYCGGFLVGYVETGDALTAGLYGAVSASFTVEQLGVPQINSEVEREARERYRELRSSSTGHGQETVP